MRANRIGPSEESSLVLRHNLVALDFVGCIRHLLARKSLRRDRIASLFLLHFRCQCGALRAIEGLGCASLEVEIVARTADENQCQSVKSIRFQDNRVLSVNLVNLVSKVVETQHSLGRLRVLKIEKKKRKVNNN